MTGQGKTEQWIGQNRGQDRGQDMRQGQDRTIANQKYQYDSMVKYCVFYRTGLQSYKIVVV